jgi:hypothetical protein
MYLHHHTQFNALLQIVADSLSIPPLLVEKDYWIMHILYGLQQQGLSFYLKGGTSLSKGYDIIQRFSEDLDILIEPPADLTVFTGPNHSKPVHCQSRRHFYDWLSQHIKIDGLIGIERDLAFDDEKYRSGGIRLYYPTALEKLKDVKEGVLLEVGFDTVSPHNPLPITSWVYEYAKDKGSFTDNRAQNVLCYHPGYTLIEKLQTISTKFRKQQEQGAFSENFMRHYYDVYCLLHHPMVLEFIGSEAYKAHKDKRFRMGDIQDLTVNEAFVLSDPALLALYEKQFSFTTSLYYREKPTFRTILKKIQETANRL